MAKTQLYAVLRSPKLHASCLKDTSSIQIRAHHVSLTAWQHLYLTRPMTSFV